MSKPRVVFSALLLFLSGVVLGAVGMQGWRHHRWERHDPQAMTDAVMRRLRGELRLTDAQAQTLAPIVSEVQEKFMAIRRENRPRMEAILDEAAQKAMPALDPSQQEDLRRLEERVKSHFDRDHPR